MFLLLLKFVFIFGCTESSFAACRLSLVAVSQGYSYHCGAQASHCGGFSRCRAQALGSQASVVAVHGL